jgi:hypothetical protein
MIIRSVPDTRPVEWLKSERAIASRVCPEAIDNIRTERSDCVTPDLMPEDSDGAEALRAMIDA